MNMLLDKNTARLLVLAVAAMLACRPMWGDADRSGTLRPVSSATGAVGPVTAPVTIVVFSDFACPYSSEVFFTLEKLEKRYPTELRVIAKQSPLPIHPDAALAHRAALAAGRQGKFNQMAELLYANQTRQDAPSLRAYARRLKLDPVRFRRDLDSPSLADAVQADIAESHAFGVDQTPTLYINGRQFTGVQTEQTLVALIDKAAASADARAKNPGAEYDAATVDAALLAEIEAQPTAVQGGANAPITIVEFTDFQCPYCRTAVAPMQQLMAARGREVRWEFRAFPLEFHKDAEPAAEAALAAGAQGKFWPMHDLLFAHQAALKPADLRTYATMLQLDMKAYDEAIVSHRYAAQIAADRALGARAGVSATPTFLVGGRLIPGAIQLAQLNQLTDAALAQNKVPGANTQAATVAASAAHEEHVIAGPKAGAPLTMTWFTDVRSPLAPRQAELVRKLMGQYGERMRVVFKAFPVAAHSDGFLGSAALLAAERQGQFWQMYDALADRRDELTRESVLATARAMKLDLEAFSRALDTAAPLVAADVAEATQRGIQGAPVFFLNTLRVDGLQREAFYTDLADRELKAAAPVAKASTTQPSR